MEEKKKFSVQISSSMPKLFLLTGVSILVVLTSGYLHGVQTNRWGADQKVKNAAGKLEDFSPVIEGWSSEKVEIPKKQLKIAEAQGHFSRRYVHRSSGKKLHVLILCGRSGPIALHPPTVCFKGAGFSLVNDPTQARIDVNSAKNTFWKANFERQVRGNTTMVQTYWGWTTDSDWKASENPRFEYAGSPFLYKLYVTESVAGSKDEGASKEFLKAFLPLVNRAISD